MEEAIQKQIQKQIPAGIVRSYHDIDPWYNCTSKFLKREVEAAAIIIIYMEIYGNICNHAYNYLYLRSRSRPPHEGLQCNSILTAPLNKTKLKINLTLSFGNATELTAYGMCSLSLYVCRIVLNLVTLMLCRVTRVMHLYIYTDDDASCIQVESLEWCTPHNIHIYIYTRIYIWMPV